LPRYPDVKGRRLESGEYLASTQCPRCFGSFRAYGKTEPETRKALDVKMRAHVRRMHRGFHRGGVGRY
jgi:hypothetical protein